MENENLEHAGSVFSGNFYESKFNQVDFVDSLLGPHTHQVILKRPTQPFVQSLACYQPDHVDEKQMKQK